ncbi:MAG: thiamine-phosphate kinase [Holophagales bacterium]|nr:thiamine-phosphate kinase [Holophagales bacterium]
MSEDELIRWLRRRAAGRGGELIGDDCALLETPAQLATGAGLDGDDTRGLAVTMDTQIAGVHFPEDLDPAIVARRLLAVNLSDLAAVGATPAHGFLALSAPAGFRHRRFLDSLLGACAAHHLSLAGGDLSHQERLTAVLTLIGSRAGRRFVERSAARAGHRLWLGGPIGESALGLALLGAGASAGEVGDTDELQHGSLPDHIFELPAWLLRSRSTAEAARNTLRRHLSPCPQLALGQWLADRPEGAAIDISDGLARDLHRMCEASGVGAELRAEQLPEPPHLVSLARAVGESFRELALFGGEDYVLLFSLPEGEAPPAGLGCTQIGRIVAGRDVVLLDGSSRTELPSRGYDHLGVSASPKP